MEKVLSSKAWKHKANARLFVYVLLTLLSLLASDTAKLASASQIEDFSNHNSTLFEDFDDDDFVDDFASLQNRYHFRHLESISTEGSDSHIRPRVKKVTKGGKLTIVFDEEI